MNYKEDNPYEILGVDQGADESTIKKAYFKLARQYHPDKQETEEDKQRVNSRFAEISDAYTLLTDPERKQKWEQWIKERQSRSSSRSRSRSPRHQAQRRPSAKRSPPPGARQKQHPMHQTSPRTQQRPVRTTKRSVSPVPQKFKSPQYQHRRSPQRSQNQSRSRQNLSPMAHRNHRRTNSPLPPRHQSPGTYRQSPSILRRTHNPNISSSPPQKPLQKPKTARRASSGPSTSIPPISSIAFSSSLREEDLRDVVKPRSCPRASWSSSISSLNHDFNNNNNNNNNEKKKKNPFEILGLHHTADKVEVISAYRELAQEYHPTRHYATEWDRKEAARKMKKVTWAYETLRDSKQLQEWQQKLSKQQQQSNNNSFNDSMSRFHDSSTSSKGSWFFPNRSRGNLPVDISSDDDDSFIGDDQRHIKSSISRSNNNIHINSPTQSTRSRGWKSSGRRPQQITSPTRMEKKKISLLATLGFPGGQRKQQESSSSSSSPKADAAAAATTDGGQQEKKKNKGPSILFSNFSLSSNKNNASPITISAEEDVPKKIERVTGEDATTEPSTELSVKKIKKKKKKKKKKKGLANNNPADDGDAVVDEQDHGVDEKTKKPKKKRKKKRKSVDYTWKREESKRVLEGSNRTTPTQEGSSRTAHEAVVEGSFADGEHHPFVVSAE